MTSAFICAASCTADVWLERMRSTASEPSRSVPAFGPAGAMRLTAFTKSSRRMICTPGPVESADTRSSKTETFSGATETGRCFTKIAMRMGADAAGAIAAGSVVVGALAGALGDADVLAAPGALADDPVAFAFGSMPAGKPCVRNRNMAPRSIPRSSIACAVEKRAPASVTRAQPTCTSSAPSCSPVSGSIMALPGTNTS